MIRRTLRIVFYLFIAYLIGGTLLVFFFSRKTNNNPLPNGYKKGAFHVHSTFSDGRGDWDEIARSASTASLDFVVITDHGSPNLAASGKNRWQNDILLIGTSEFSLYSGHLMAGAFPVPAYRFPPEPQDTIDEVALAGGLSVISHPFDRSIPWTDWSVRNFSGIEIFNAYQTAKTASIFKLVLFPGRYLIHPDYALTSLFSPPRRELEKWDQCNQRGQTYGYFALDSHGQLRLKPFGQIPIPSYESMFRILTLYIQAEREWERDANVSANIVFTALKSGRFFNCIESLAPANGFDFYFQDRNQRQIPMGATSDCIEGTLACLTPFDFPYRLHLIHNGQTVRKEKTARNRKFQFPVSSPGVYRVEIYLDDGPFSRLPWILSNPIFLGTRHTAPPTSLIPTPIRALSLDELGFTTEKNQASSATIDMEKVPDNPSHLLFRFHLQQESNGSPDFWTTLACRHTPDFSQGQGLLFSVQGSERLRFWLQVRTHDNSGESAFQHSFVADREWKTVAIPFDSFHRLSGRATQIDASRIASVFFLIDGINSYSGKRGFIRLKNPALF